MDIKDFIESGIIEIYCMGSATEEEVRLVEKLSKENKEVRDELISVQHALEGYTKILGKSPNPDIKNRIMDKLEEASSTRNSLEFPFILSGNSTVEEWMKYIADNSISPPADFENIYVEDLPGNDKLVTYIAWAREHSSLEETHEDQDEYLFMLKGKCSITLNGKIEYYKKGDLIYIPRKTIHRAVALSGETMIVVGQRIAA